MDRQDLIIRLNERDLALSPILPPFPPYGYFPMSVPLLLYMFDEDRQCIYEWYLVLSLKQ